MESWPRKWDVDFQLLARGGFLVSSSMRGGTIRFVEILSQAGGECRVRNPWPGCEVELLVEGRKQDTLNGSLLKFNTKKGKTYLLVSAGKGNVKDLAVAVPAMPVAKGQGRAAPAVRTDE